MRGHGGAHHAVLQAADGVQRRFHGQELVVHLQRAVHLLHGALGVVGVVNGKAFGNAQMLALAAQDAHAGRVEGGGVHILPGLPQHGGKAVFQLARRLVGKGDGEDAVRPDGLLRQHGRQRLAGRAARLHQPLQLGHMRACKPRGHKRRVIRPAEAHQVGDAVHKHGGFAAARARQNEQRPLGVKHRLALHGVQFAELPLDILFSQRQKARGKFLFHESPAFFVLCAGAPPQHKLKYYSTFARAWKGTRRQFGCSFDFFWQSTEKGGRTCGPLFKRSFAKKPGLPRQTSVCRDRCFITDISTHPAYPAPDG